jgi:hypothetical protein
MQAPTLLRTILLSNASKRRFHASKIIAHALSAVLELLRLGNFSSMLIQLAQGSSSMEGQDIPLT